MSAIKVPDFKVDEDERIKFAETVADMLLKHYITKEHFGSKVYLYEDTRLNMNLTESMKILATPDGEYTKEEFADSLKKTSLQMVSAIPNITSILTSKLPDLLRAMHWECKEITFTLFDPGYVTWKGKNPNDLTRNYGASVCNLVLHLNPLNECPWCARSTYQPKHKPEANNTHSNPKTSTETIEAHQPKSGGGGGGGGVWSRPSGPRGLGGGGPMPSGNSSGNHRSSQTSKNFANGK
jgi:hypothetical protein